MSDSAAPLLEHWKEFYLLVGTAAAALVALLFVAASIGAEFITPERAARTRTFMSPVVLHFSAVLVACSLGLIPSHTRASLGVLIGAGAIGGGIYSVLVAIKVLKNQTLDLPDRLFYGIVPLGGYAAGIVAAELVLAGAHRAADVLAAAILLLLIVNIRNAWDLMLFFAEKHSDAHTP